MPRYDSTVLRLATHSRAISATLLLGIVLLRSRNKLQLVLAGAVLLLAVGVLDALAWGGTRKEIGDVRDEIATVRVELGKEFAAVRADLGKEISDLRKDLGDVRKEITVQTRWILVVMGAATVLFPIMQRVTATLLP